MVPRKLLAPNNGAARKTLWSGPAYVRFPKYSEIPSVATWASPGKSADGNAISGGTYRPMVISKQFGTM